jgi:predicted phosphodiesterase
MRTHLNWTLCAILLAASLAAGGGAWAGDAIAIGPYIQNVTTDSAVVCWATVKSESKLADAEGKEQVLRQYNHHELAFADLKAGTTYSYDVLGTGAPEDKGTFTTFPEGLTPFRFAVIGDTRSNHEVHSRILKRVAAEKPLLLINSGDLISDGRNIADWEAFFEVSRDVMRTIPYYPVLGNHEKDSKYYFDFFSLPGNERYYMFSVGDALFIVLDQEGHYYPTPEFMDEKAREAWWSEQNIEYMKKQRDWLEHRLSLTKSAGFVFVAIHEPMYSVKASRVEDAALRRAFWGNIFERYKVQVVVNGHDHHYHRAIHGGTHYVTAAGGGAGLYDVDAPQPESVIWKKVHHYMTVDVGKDTATLRTIDIDGNPVDTFTVDRRK